MWPHGRSVGLPPRAVESLLCPGSVLGLVDPCNGASIHFLCLLLSLFSPSPRAQYRRPTASHWSALELVLACSPRGSGLVDLCCLGLALPWIVLCVSGVNSTGLGLTVLGTVLVFTLDLFLPGASAVVVGERRPALPPYGSPEAGSLSLPSMRYH